MTALRQRMIDDMRIRNYSPETIRAYVGCVARFAKYCGACPSNLGPEAIRQYQLHLIREQRSSWEKVNQAACALRFLYSITLDRDFVTPKIPYSKLPKRLPVVLSHSEIARLIKALHIPYHRTILLVLYGTGMRVSEVIDLCVCDIDSERMVIRVCQGKGQKDRYVPLSRTLLNNLRDYWKQYRPTSLLFPSNKKAGSICRRTIRKFIAEGAKRAGIQKRVHPHTIRHTCATHLLEAGVGLKTIQIILGHSCLSTTSKYLHLSPNAPQMTDQAKDLLAALENIPDKK